MSEKKSGLSTFLSDIRNFRLNYSSSQVKSRVRKEVGSEKWCRWRHLHPKQLPEHRRERRREPSCLLSHGGYRTTSERRLHTPCARTGPRMGPGLRTHCSTRMAMGARSAAHTKARHTSSHWARCLTSYRAPPSPTTNTLRSPYRQSRPMRRGLSRSKPHTNLRMIQNTRC